MKKEKGISLKRCKAGGLLLFALSINFCYFYWKTLSFSSVPTIMQLLNTDVHVNRNYSRLPVVTRKTTSLNNDDSTFYIAPKIMNSVGLGNKMTVYASVVGLAHTKNMTAVIQAKHPLRTIFHLQAKVLQDENKFKNFQTITSEKCCKYDEMFVKLPRSQNYMINNLLQSWKYFNDIKSNIRHHFRFKDHIQFVAEKRIAGIRQKYKQLFSGEITLIGLHVRRGDKDTKEARETGNYLATPDFIKRSMAYFISNFTNCVFVVCTDSKSWVKENVKSVSPIEFIFEKNSPEVDLAILSLCNHTIMTVGTFGWWGGYLAGGRVVYYANPYDEQDELWRKIFNKTDFYPPDWIPML